MLKSGGKKLLNRIIQAIPILCFIVFLIYYYANGDVDFYDETRCTDGYNCFFIGMTNMFLLGGTMIIYTIIFIISLTEYSPKYNVTSYISLFVFLFVVSRLGYNPTKQVERKMAIEQHTFKVEQLNTRSDIEGLREKTKNLKSLGFLTKNHDYYLEALSTIDKAIEQDSTNHILYLDKNQIYLSLASDSKDSEYYRKSIHHLEHSFDVIGNTIFYSEGDVAIHVKETAKKWARQSENEEDILEAISHLEKYEYSLLNRYSQFYEKLYELTAKDIYVDKAISTYKKEISIYMNAKNTREVEKLETKIKELEAKIDTNTDK